MGMGPREGEIETRQFNTWLSNKGLTLEGLTKAQKEALWNQWAKESGTTSSYMPNFFTDPKADKFAGQGGLIDDPVFNYTNVGRNVQTGPADVPEGSTSILGTDLGFEGEDLVAAAMNEARPLINEEVFNFSGGLVTDMSPMQSKGNTSVDEQNMLLIEDGSRARRRGLTHETSYTRNGGEYAHIRPFRWVQGNDGSESVIVVYVNNTTAFESDTLTIEKYDPGDFTTVSTSKTALASTIKGNIYRIDDLATVAGWGNEFYLPMCTQDGSSPAAFLAITNLSTGEVLTSCNVYVRDHWGVDDSLKITERPASVTDAHLYNLVNQGWDWDNIQDFYNAVGKYPSNADVVWFGKDTNNVYIPERLQQLPYPEGAPRGSCFINMQTFDRTEDEKAKTEFTAASKTISNVTDDIQYVGIAHMAEFGGRVFMACNRETMYDGGNNNVPDMENFIFFSKTITSPIKETGSTHPSAQANSFSTVSDCYSEFDPTSEDFSPSSNDGGFYALPEIGNVLGLQSLGDSLLIFANNGIWSLSTGGLFDPTQAILNKQSNIPVTSARSIVKAEQSIYFLSNSGIYAIDSALNITKPSEGKVDYYIRNNKLRFRDSTYNTSLSEIHWLLQDEYTFGTGETMTLEQKELIYNIRTKSWSQNTYPTATLTRSASDSIQTLVAGDTSLIAGYVSLPEAMTGELPTRNTDGSTTTEDVTRHTPVEIRRATVGLKYLIVDYVDVSNKGYTFADTTTDTYTDFIATSNTEKDAYIITQYDNDTDSQRKRQVGHLTTNFYRTEVGVEDPGGGYVAANQGGCLLDYFWDYAQRTPTEQSNREKNIYRLLKDYTISGASDPYDYGQAVVTTRSKLRGRGRTLQLSFKSQADKDLQIIGYGITKKINRRA
jgi:hypothetical protein